MQAATLKVEKERKEWIAAQRAARKKQQSEINKGGAGLRRDLRLAEEAYALADRLVVTAENALAFAEKTLNKCGSPRFRCPAARQASLLLGWN